MTRVQAVTSYAPPKPGGIILIKASGWRNWSRGC